MNGWIGITLGDVTGVGPEVTLKALAADKTDTRYLLIGDQPCLDRLNQQLDLKVALKAFATYQQSGRFFTVNPLNAPLPEKMAPGSAESANAAVAWLREGAALCLRGELDAMVTAPVNKEAIVKAGHAFVGQTEFLSQLAKAERTAMMLLGQDERGRWLRVALVTTHVPLKLVPQQITAEKIELAIQLAVRSCRDLHLKRARVVVCGLNPHAGEGGQMGDEEIKVIAPVVESLQKRGVDVVGPLSGDTVFYHALRGEYDTVVAMYHDQGLAPLKAVAFERGINWTLGLPFIRTSPDHGTAYNIAGNGIADPSSMTAAIQLARQLAAGKV